MRLYQRFSDGRVIGAFPRVTTDETLKLFPQRRTGLRILLIHASIREWSWPNIGPLGQEYVASAAWMDGHDVRVLDLNAERGRPIEYDERFLRWMDRRVEWALDYHEPDVVGVSGIISQYSAIRRVARLVRMARPQAIIVLGGGIASCLPKFMAERLPVDVVVQEEGEVTISEVLERIELKAGFAGVKGTVYKAADGRIVDNSPRPSVKAGVEGLDHLPWPLRALWPEDEVYKRNPVGHLNLTSKWVAGERADDTPFSMSMIASRGCPYSSHSCLYCYSAYLGSVYRLRSPTEVVDEMQWLVSRYSARYIHFLDDLLLTDYRWALALADEILRRKLDVEWGGTCRTNIVADDVLRARREGRPSFLEKCHEAGLRHIGYGVESASPTILKTIDKSGQSLPKLELAIIETQRILGYADTSWMVGSPGETKETIQESVDFCKRVGLQPEVFFFVTAYPATAFWALALNRGLIRKAVTGEVGPADDDIIEQYFLRLGEQGDMVRTNFSETLSDEEVEQLAREAVRELNPMGSRICEPHSGDMRGVVGATRADI